MPVGFSPEALARFGLGHTAPLLQELGHLTSDYERVGIDRALAIAIDLAYLGCPRGARILDVGCSVGTIARLLSEIGYEVTGIESDVVAKVQEWQDTIALRDARTTYAGPRCQFLEVDVRDHLASGPSYDVALLLSVVHHWLEGYGYKGESRFTREEVRDTLHRLCDCVRRFLYVEVPIVDEALEMPPDPQGEFLFPGWFLDAGLATRAQFIASTVATNGKPRRLYRIDLT